VIESDTAGRYPHALVRFSEVAHTLLYLISLLSLLKVSSIALNSSLWLNSSKGSLFFESKGGSRGLANAKIKSGPSIVINDCYF
jgi:hypothetical protein